VPLAGSGDDCALCQHSVLERHPDVAWQRVQGEVVLLHCRSRRLLGLNPTAARTWDLLDGRRTLDEIASTIAREFGAPPDAVTADVMTFAGALAERELCRIVPSQSPRLIATGGSR
jgi:hypothetical protein